MRLVRVSSVVSCLRLGGFGLPAGLLAMYFVWLAVCGVLGSLFAFSLGLIAVLLAWFTACV